MTTTPSNVIPGMATSVVKTEIEKEKAPGISKHLYSTDPNPIVGENLYSADRTSVNREESYQTLDNRTIPVDTREKINPFNVKGVPGCKQCGGSGWRDDKNHPHPCNECAKKTVPVIDTHLTKVGHTTTPLVTSTIPIREEVAIKEEVTEPVIQTENVPVTVKEPVLREVEKVEEVPVTKEVHYTENVPVTTKVPVTTYEEVTKNVPVEKTKEITENVKVATRVPVLDEVEKTKMVPMSKEIIKEPVVEETVIKEPLTGTGLAQGFREGIYPTTTAGGTLATPIDNFEMDRNRALLKDTHIHDKELKHPYVVPFQGVPGCKECGGDGWRRSKLTGGKKPCRHCVEATGNCPLCENTGMRIDKNKKCKCLYASRI